MKDLIEHHVIMCRMISESWLRERMSHDAIVRKLIRMCGYRTADAREGLRLALENRKEKSCQTNSMSRTIAVTA